MQHTTALAAHANNNTIAAATVAAMLASVSTTFASVTYVTQVKTAAAHKALNVQKVVTANVQLFANIKAATSVFANAVKRSAAQIASNDAANVAAYTVSAHNSYFAHTACYSIVQHKTKATQYLYAIYNNAQSTHYIDGVAATQQQVAALLTPSAAKAMLQSSNVVVNKTHDIAHSVQVRTIALANIVSLTANKQVLAVA